MLPWPCQWWQLLPMSHSRSDSAWGFSGKDSLDITICIHEKQILTKCLKSNPRWSICANAVRRVMRMDLRWVFTQSIYWCFIIGTDFYNLILMVMNHSGTEFVWTSCSFCCRSWSSGCRPCKILLRLYYDSMHLYDCLHWRHSQCSVLCAIGLFF